MEGFNARTRDSPDCLGHRLSVLFQDRPKQSGAAYSPSSVVEVSKLPQKSIAFPLICDGVLVKNLGHNKALAPLITPSHSSSAGSPLISSSGRS